MSLPRALDALRFAEDRRDEVRFKIVSVYKRSALACGGVVVDPRL